MTATKTVDLVKSFAGIFDFDDTEQLPEGATRPAYNDNGSLRSYYDVTGTKQFTAEGLEQFFAVLQNAVTLVPAYSYVGDNWDYTAIK